MSRKPPKQAENNQKETFCQTQEDRNLENYLENVSSTELVTSNDDHRNENETRSAQNRYNYAGRTGASNEPRRCATAGPQYRSPASHSSRAVCEGCGCFFPPQQHVGRCAAVHCDQCAAGSGGYHREKCNTAPVQYIQRPCSAGGARYPTQRCQAPQPKCVPRPPSQPESRCDSKQRGRSKNSPRLVSAIGVKSKTRQCTFANAQCDSRPCSTIESQCDQRPCSAAEVQCDPRPCSAAEAQCDPYLCSTTEMQCDPRSCSAAEAQYDPCLCSTTEMQCDPRSCSAAEAQCDDRPCSTVEAQCEPTCSTVDASCNSTRCATFDAECNSIPCSTVDADCNSRLYSTADAECESRPCTATEAQCDPYAYTTVEAQCEPRPCSTAESQYDSRPCTATETQYEPCGRTTAEAQCESRPCSTAEAQCESRPCSTVEVQCDQIPYAMNETQCDPSQGERRQPEVCRKENTSYGQNACEVTSSYCSRVPSTSFNQRGTCPSYSASNASLICQAVSHTSKIPIVNSSTNNSYCSRVPSVQECSVAPPSCPISAQPSTEVCKTTVPSGKRGEGKKGHHAAPAKPANTGSAHGATKLLTPSAVDCHCSPCVCPNIESKLQQSVPKEGPKVASVEDSKTIPAEITKVATVEAALVVVPEITTVESVPVVPVKDEPVPTVVDSKIKIEEDVPTKEGITEEVAVTVDAVTTEEGVLNEESQVTSGDPASDSTKAAAAASTDYVKPEIAAFSSETALGSASAENSSTSKPSESKSDSALLPSRSRQRRNKITTFKGVHSVQPEIDLVALRSTSRTSLQERLSTSLKPGLSGLMEFISERSIARGKKREQLKKGGHAHHDEEKDFIDYFLDCNGLKYLGILEQFQLDYEDRCKSEMLNAEPTNSKIAQMLRKRLANIAQVQPSTDEKAMMDIEFADLLDQEFKVIPIDYKPKVIAIGRLHEYGIEMAEYWVHRIKHGKVIDPHEICEVGTQTAAEMMGQIFSLLVKCCEFLDLIGKDPNKYKSKFNVDLLTQFFTTFRQLVVEEIGAIGETCGQVMVRIPGLKKSKVDGMMSDLYGQINFADICLSRGLLAVIPMILYFDFRPRNAQ
ncbi:unnamed protein product [Orchesella dallaii]|uniref:Uncharacterized protein n=1 Tax=Orchesella dallaii TaxID=48710 RepID=A0ABP1QPR5_9HEXA